MSYKAVYTDGMDFIGDWDHPNSNMYYQIDQSKLKFLELYWDNELIHRLHFEPNQRLILTRRTLRSFSKVIEVRYLIGVQETIQGQNHQAITVIFEDGHTEFISKWKDGMMSETIIK